MISWLALQRIASHVTSHQSHISVTSACLCQAVSASSIIDSEQNLKAFVFFVQEGLGLPEVNTTGEFGPALSQLLKRLHPTLCLVGICFSLMMFH